MEHSIKEDIIDCISEWVEPVLDSKLEEGILKEIPLIAQALKIYNISKTFREQHNIGKLKTFIDELNAGVADQKKIERYRNRITKDDEGNSPEIQYILILLERHIGRDKPRMLAKLFLAYLSERISWNEFSVYAEMIDRFLPGDYDVLASMLDTEFIVDFGNEVQLRLMAMGLVYQTQQITTEIKDMIQIVATPDKARYRVTASGEKLIRILS